MADFDLPIVDPHMHLWDFDRHYYSWLQDDPLPNNPAGNVAPIARTSYRIDDYLADTAAWNVTKTVHVECGLPKKDQLSETNWLQAIADKRGYPQAIVAGAALNDPDVEYLLAGHSARPNVRGIRQIVNWHADPLKTYTPHDLLENSDWRGGFALLRKYNLSFDLQIYPSQMPAAARLAAEFPETPIVLNHTGMPTDRDGEGIAAWKSGMAMLAAQPNVSVKISGLGMVDRTWSVASIAPFVLTTIELFGVDRAMFASNFPVDRIHGAFAKHYGAFDDITRSFTRADRAQLFGETAAAIYRINA